MVRAVATIGYLYVDGHLADRPIIDCGISGERDDAISDGVPKKKNTVKPFTFSKIEVTGKVPCESGKIELIIWSYTFADDDAYKGLHGSHGQVVISIWAIAVLEPLKRTPKVKVPDNQKIHEKIKKTTNTTHCVKYVSRGVLHQSGSVSLLDYSRFGEETKTKGTPFETLNFEKLHDAPLLTFVFRYRPKGQKFRQSDCR